MNISDEAVEAACTCTVTNPTTWTTYGGAVESVSAMEPAPNCPTHFGKASAWEEGWLAAQGYCVHSDGPERGIEANPYRPTP